MKSAYHKQSNIALTVGAFGDSATPLISVTQSYSWHPCHVTWIHTLQTAFEEVTNLQ